MSNQASEKPFAPLVPARLKVAEVVRTVWQVIVPSHVTKEDLLKSEFWTHMAKRFKPFDRIEVRADNDTFFAEILVVACGQTWVKMHPLGWAEIEPMKEEDLVLPDGFEIRHRGAVARWSVIRTKGKKLLSENHASRGDALNWLKEHQKAL